MSVFGDKFFDHLTIHHIRRSPLYDAEEGKCYYVFALSVGGILISGMTFNASNGSIKFPSTSHGGRKLRYVSAPGQLVNVVRDKLKQKIEELEGEEALAA